MLNSIYDIYYIKYALLFTDMQVSELTSIFNCQAMTTACRNAASRTFSAEQVFPFFFSAFSHFQKTARLPFQFFRTYFPPQAAQCGCTLTVSDGVKNETFHDIAIGEVYLANGQSNMELELQNANEGRELIVSSDKVKAPKRLRYLYSKPWVGSLYAGDSGLPLGPFEVTAAPLAKTPGD